MDYEKIVIVGWVGKKPELRYTPYVWTRWDGSVGAIFELTASVVRFGARADGEKTGNDQHGGEANAGYTEDDIPF